MSEPLARSVPALLPLLRPEAELVVLARCLFREGWDDHLAGHITYRQPDGSILVNPWELTWDELTPRDVMRIDAGGAVISGLWSVTPGITLHLELHKARPDVVVAVHNHSRWATIYCDIGRIPAVYDQTSAMVNGDPALHDEYDGTVDDVGSARRAIAALGGAKSILLANHGPLVVADSIRQAHLRAITLEWRCRQAWHVEAAGGGVPMRPETVATMGHGADAYGFPGLWEAMARRELRMDPGLLD